MAKRLPRLWRWGGKGVEVVDRSEQGDHSVALFFRGGAARGFRGRYGDCGWISHQSWRQ
jgi:hypothetical protein